MIIAVDYDGTLFAEHAVNLALLNRLRGAQSHGHTVILWTCREGPSLQEALEILRGAGFVPNFVNSNAPAFVRRFGKNPRKIYADLYIDDKAVKMEFSHGSFSQSNSSPVE